MIVYVYACKMCGAEIRRPAGKPGRPTTTCSQECRNAAERAYRHRQTAARVAAQAANLRAILAEAEAEARGDAA